MDKNEFKEVVDFFNDIMHTIDVAALDESKIMLDLLDLLYI